MEDDSSTPLSADDIIPILTSEASLASTPGNPYYLIQADKGMWIIYETVFVMTTVLL